MCFVWCFLCRSASTPAAGRGRRWRRRRRRRPSTFLLHVFFVLVGSFSGSAATHHIKNYETKLNKLGKSCLRPVDSDEVSWCCCSCRFRKYVRLSFPSVGVVACIIKVPSSYFSVPFMLPIQGYIVLYTQLHVFDVYIYFLLYNFKWLIQNIINK